MKKDNILGILGGIAVGAVLGILFAPDKGSKTRAKIKDKAIDTKNSLQESVNSILDEVKENISNLKDKEEDLLHQGKNTLNNLEKHLK